MDKKENNNEVQKNDIELEIFALEKIPDSGLKLKKINDLLEIVKKESNQLYVDYLDNLRYLIENKDNKKNENEIFAKSDNMFKKYDNYLFLYQLGKIYLDKRQNKKALEYFLSVDELKENSEIVKLSIGEAYFHLKNYEKALKYVFEAISIDPCYYLAYYHYGKIYNSTENFDQAELYLKKAYELNPDVPLAMNGLGNVYRNKGDNAHAVAWYKKASESNPANPLYFYNLASVHYLSGDLNKALSEYKRVYELYDKTNNYFGKATVENQIEKIRNSINAIEFRKKKPDSPTNKVVIDTEECGMTKKVRDNKKSFLDFVKEKFEINISENNYLEVLRRWNSYTPIIADNYHVSKGGGYFLKVNGKGIVIDPGFNFIENFKGSGHKFWEIDIILITHAHNDHTADLESILTLLHKYNSEIKDSDDDKNDSTIRKSIAREKNISPKKVTKEEIDESFRNSDRRKTIDIYIPLGVFKKFDGMFNLFEKDDYTVYPIKKGDIIEVSREDSFTIKVLYAKHDDITTDIHSVGFSFQFKNSTIIYTGDTGWNKTVEDQYKKIKSGQKDKNIVLLAHIGGFKEEENDYVGLSDDYSSFYKNHLGRLGLARINEVLEPKLCFISEFGEELRGNRILLSKIFNDAFNGNVLFLPADIGLKYDIISGEIEVINKVDIENYKITKEYIEPHKVSVSVCELRKDYSLHYFEKRENLSESNLIQVLAEQYEESMRDSNNRNKVS